MWERLSEVSLKLGEGEELGLHVFPFKSKGFPDFQKTPAFGLIIRPSAKNRRQIKRIPSKRFSMRFGGHLIFPTRSKWRTSPHELARYVAPRNRLKGSRCQPTNFSVARTRQSLTKCDGTLLVIASGTEIRGLNLFVQVHCLLHL